MIASPEIRKEVLFAPFPKQIEFLEAVFSNKYNIIMYGGAIRGGKTFAGLGALLLLCKKYPKSRWAVVRNNLPSLKRNTIPSFNKICPRSFIRSYNQDTQTVTFNNESQILFFAENFDDDKDLNRWRGLEVSGFLLEEVNELNELSFNKAIERAGSHIIENKPKAIIICTCNPASNWVKDKFYDAYEKSTLPANWLYIPAKIFDNPFIDEDYMNNLKTLPRLQYEMFVEGNWNVSEKSGYEFYKEFDLDYNVSDNATYNPLLPIWISIDENINPYFPATIWQVDGKKANCIDEIALRNPRNTVVDLAKEFKMMYPSHESGVYLTGDATSQKDDVKIEKGMNLFRLIQNELIKLGVNPQLRVSKSNPNVVTRQQFMNVLFYNQKRGEPYEGIQIFFNPKCKLTVQDYVNIKESSDGKGKHKEMDTDPKTGIRSQKYGHMSDTGDYVLCNVFRTEYEKHNKGGIEFIRSFGAKESSPTHSY